jgi:hypothetical protein
MASSRPFECPVCGEDVPAKAKAKACPSCGACEKSGWNEDAGASDGLDLPDDDFDYDKFTEEEFGEPRKKQGIKFIWWLTALILLVLMIGLAAYNMLLGR